MEAVKKHIGTYWVAYWLLLVVAANVLMSMNLAVGFSVFSALLIGYIMGDIHRDPKYRPADSPALSTEKEAA